MNFKLPNYNPNDEYLKMLEDIQLSQKNILEKFTELNNRISELEQFQRDFSLAVQKKVLLLLILFSMPLFQLTEKRQNLSSTSNLKKQLKIFIIS